MTNAAALLGVAPFSLERRSRVSVHHPPSLAELFGRVVRRDRDAFSALYDELSPMVFGLAMRTTRSKQLAEEVTQEVFIQIWREAERFDSSRGSARSWVATLAHRRSVDTVRRTQSAADREEAVPPQGPDIDVAERVVDDEERRRVRAAMGELTDLQREAIELAYFGGLTYREVAEHLGAPLGTVKSRMRDGLARIRASMEQTDG
jgi:RNA polymerase sigma-70 factor (ECF subfamily)